MLNFVELFTKSYGALVVMGLNYFVIGLFLVVAISYFFNRSASRDFQKIDETLEKVNQLCAPNAPQTKSEKA